MKYIKLLPFAIISLFFSCEKVIDIDLNESEKQVVIEAKLSEGTQSFSVIISQTAPYFESQSPQSVDNAIVTLRDETGSALLIPFQQNGIYTSEVTAISGRTYTLDVQIEDKIYTANTFLPEKVELTELYTEFRAAMGPNDEGYLVYFRYEDPPGVKNYYRVVHSVNGVPQNTGEDLQVLNDDFNDGSNARFALFQQFFQIQDTVEVVLQHFDETSYDYYNSLGDIVSGGVGFGGGSVAPGNPNSVWSDDALGYFSAIHSDTLSIIVSE